MAITLVSAGGGQEGGCLRLGTPSLSMWVTGSSMMPTLVPSASPSQAPGSAPSAAPSLSPSAGPAYVLVQLTRRHTRRVLFLLWLPYLLTRSPTDTGSLTLWTQDGAAATDVTEAHGAALHARLLWDDAGGCYRVCNPRREVPARTARLLGGAEGDEVRTSYVLVEETHARNSL